MSLAAEIKQADADEVAASHREYHRILVAPKSEQQSLVRDLPYHASILKKTTDDIAADERAVAEIRQAVPQIEGIGELDRNHRRIKEKASILGSQENFNTPHRILQIAIKERIDERSNDAHAIAVERDKKIAARDTIEKHKRARPDLFAALVKQDGLTDKLGGVFPDETPPPVAQAEMEHHVATTEVEQWKKNVLPQVVDQLETLSHLLNAQAIKKSQLITARDRERHTNRSTKIVDPFAFAAAWLFATVRDGRRHPISELEEDATAAGIDKATLPGIARHLGLVREGDGANAVWRI